MESGLLNSSRGAANLGKRLHMRALVILLRPIKVISHKNLEERLAQAIGIEIAFYVLIVVSSLDRNGGRS